ncbi:MAG: TIM barrel protein [Planctomycetes bacterium]|nr:TIM barrel protein [Planctomycetota bacterium]
MPQLGVCSWSLCATSSEDLSAKVKALALGGIHLALDPIREGLWDESQCRRDLEAAGLRIASGMMATLGEDYTSLETIRATGGIVPDAHWETNLASARDNALLAKRLGLSLVTLHAGFIPHAQGDDRRAVLLDRLRQVADAFGDQDIQLGLETGQESAETLEIVLEELDRANVGVNFDPANMILYGMGDPVIALDRLAPSVLQIHVKDAKKATKPGNWGTEVPVGTGDVDWRAFFDLYHRRGLACDLMIEREVGDQRMQDITTARDLVRATLSGTLE